MRFPRVRPASLPAWLALLALAVRLVLPALHSHDHAHGPASSSTAAAACCACGSVHAPATPARGEARIVVAAAPVEPHTCLACELEFGKPPAPPPPATAVPVLAYVHAAPDALPATAATTALRADGHPCRAPPATRRPFV